jgi:hypothetical protein
MENPQECDVVDVSHCCSHEYLRGWGLARGRDWLVVSRAKAILWLTGPVASIVLAIIIPVMIFGKTEAGDPLPVTMQQVRAALDPEEPDYNQAAQLGPDAIPHLESLVRGPDPMLASKAAYLASLIQDSRSVTILKEAGLSKYPEVRIAAAAGARNLPAPAASDVLLSLVSDHDIGVRMRSLKSVPIDATPVLRKKSRR